MDSDLLVLIRRDAGKLTSYARRRTGPLILGFAEP